MKTDKIILRIYDEKTQEFNFINLFDIHDLNQAIDDGYTKDIINMSEIMLDRRIGLIADKIKRPSSPKIILISGPSSSGKTTFTKRLSLHLMARGLKPYPISLDDYFVDREKTPIDENGEYDYESIDALDVKLFNKHMKMLLEGKEIIIPKYDFPSGRSLPDGHHMRLDNDMVSLLEGIHALNPILTKEIPDELKFKIYVSALAPIIDEDEKHIISRTDSRLIRRIIRDHKYRGASALATISRWASVRRGEEKWVFPFQEYADVEFNSVQIYELSLLKNYVNPLLDEVPTDIPEYEIVCRLRELLNKFHSIEDSLLIPPVSILREFIGGSAFYY